MVEYDIKKEIKKCRHSASRGYKLARTQYDKLNEALTVAGNSINSTIIELNNSPCYISDVTQSLSEQLSNVKNTFGFVSSKLLNDIVDLEQELSFFKITLFGRTMAGKSTLMEILTEGNGESIGKGAQRTTREVRMYEWNNLHITDVPGIGAFEGKEDEDIAYEAAKKADLIVLLVTDDGPQKEEAECLYTLRQLGKPILCVMNVKVTVDLSKLKLTVRDINKKFDEQRLSDIRNQFLTYASSFGQSWDDIPFVYVHLKAAFESLHNNDSETSKMLNDLSRIDSLKKAVIDEVKTHGQYYRLKTFIDTVSVPVLDVVETLFEQSNKDRGLQLIVDNKTAALKRWKKSFIRDSRSQIEALVSNIESQLNSEASIFAEDHFKDKKSSEKWNTLIEEKHLSEQCETVLSGISTQCFDKLQEIAREIEKETSYFEKINDKNPFSIIKMRSVVNGKKIWKWGSIGLSGGLTITSGILFLAGSNWWNPIGWVAMGVGVIGGIGSIIFNKLGNSDDKARKKLEEQLNKSVTSISKSLSQQMFDALNKLEKEQINAKITELEKINSVLSRLAISQKKLGVILLPCYAEQSKKIVSAALNMMWKLLTPNKINQVARIPGNILALCTTEHKSISGKTLDKLEELMQEQVICLPYNEIKMETVKSMLSDVCQSNSLVYNESTGNCNVVLLSNSPKAVDRVRLGEQLIENIIDFKVVSENV